MSAPTEKFTELMTLCDENQETMNADKVRQVMEAVAAIRDEWPEPEDSEKFIDLPKPSSVYCNHEPYHAYARGNEATKLEIRVGGTEWHGLQGVYGKKRKVKICLDEEKAAGVHHVLGVYLETKKARRAERVVATCENVRCYDDRLLEGDPRAGWLRCEECGKSFCCKRCAVDHFGVNEICTGRCVSIA